MKKEFRLLIIASAVIALAAVPLYILRPAKAAGDILLAGMVKSAQGAKMGGVTVSARAEGSDITTSVFTDSDGAYYFPKLPGGSYRVWAQATGYDLAPADLQMNDTVTHQDFTMKTIDDVAPQLTGDQWLASLPEDTREDRRMKEVIRLNCVGCHTPAFPLQNKFDEKGWLTMVNMMSRQREGGQPPLGLDQPPMPAVNYFKPELAAYLARMRGPGFSPIKYKLRPRPTGEAAMAVVTEYKVPLPEGGYGSMDGSDWSQGTPGRAWHTHDVQIDFNGNLWSSDWTPNMTRTVVKVDAKTGKATNFRVPGLNGYAAPTHAIIKDEQGVLWFNVKVAPGLHGGRLGRLDPATEKIELFEAPPDMPGVGDFLDYDGKGNIWVAAGDGETRWGLLRFDPVAKKFSYFKSPLGAAEGTDYGIAGMYGVTADSQGNGWFSHFSSDMEAKVDIETGKVTEIKMPRRPDNGLFTEDEKKVFTLEGQSGFNWGTPWASGPRRPGGDKHGNAVWVPGWWDHQLAKIDIGSLKITQYPMPSADFGAYMAQVDNHHNVWINYQNSGTVSKFDPSTGKWTVYSLPTPSFDTHEIGILDHDGQMQVAVACIRSSKIARLQFRNQADMNVLKAEVQQLQRQQMAASR